MKSTIGPDVSSVGQESGSVLAIAWDLQRLASELGRACQDHEAMVGLPLEDARYALSRAIVAVREVLVATVVAPRHSAA
jgi:hypothetical protein